MASFLLTECPWLDYLEHIGTLPVNLVDELGQEYEPLYPDAIIGTWNDGLHERIDDIIEVVQWIKEHPSALICLPWKQEQWMKDNNWPTTPGSVVLMHSLTVHDNRIFGRIGLSATRAGTRDIDPDYLAHHFNRGPGEDKSAFGKSFVPSAEDFWNCEIASEALLNLKSSTKKTDTGFDHVLVKKFKKDNKFVLTFKPEEIKYARDNFWNEKERRGGHKTKAITLLMSELKRAREVADDEGLITVAEAKEMWWIKWATLWIIAKYKEDDLPDVEVKTDFLRSSKMYKEYAQRNIDFEDFCKKRDEEGKRDDDARNGPAPKRPKSGGERNKGVDDGFESGSSDTSDKTDRRKTRKNKSRPSSEKGKSRAGETEEGKTHEDQSRTVTPEDARGGSVPGQVGSNRKSSKSTLRSLARKRGQPDDSSSSSSSSSFEDDSDSDVSSVDLTALTGPERAIMELKAKKLKIARKNLKEKRRTRRHHKKQRKHSKKLFQAHEDQAAEMQWMREAQEEEAQKKSDRKSTTHKWTDEQVRLLNLASSKQFVERNLPELTPEAKRMFKSSGTVSSMIESVRKESRKWRCNVIDSCLAHVFSFGLHNADITNSLAGFSTSMFVPKKVDQVDFTRKDQVRRLFQQNLGDGDLPTETINELAELKVYFVKWSDLDDALKIMECCVQLLTFILGEHNVGANVYRKGFAWARDNYSSMTYAINNDRDRTFLLKYLFLLDRHFHNSLRLLIENGGELVDPMNRPQTILQNYAENSFNAELGPFVTGAGGAVGNLTLPSRLGAALYLQDKKPENPGGKAQTPSGRVAEKAKVVPKDKKVDPPKKKDAWSRSKEPVPSKWKLPGGKKFAEVFGKIAPDQNKAGFPKLPHHVSGDETTPCLRFHSVGMCDFGTDCRMAHSLFSKIEASKNKIMTERSRRESQPGRIAGEKRQYGPDPPKPTRVKLPKVEDKVGRGREGPRSARPPDQQNEDHLREASASGRAQDHLREASAIGRAQEPPRPTKIERAPLPPLLEEEVVDPSALERAKIIYQRMVDDGAISAWDKEHEDLQSLRDAARRAPFVEIKIERSNRKSKPNEEFVFMDEDGRIESEGPSPVESKSNWPPNTNREDDPRGRASRERNRLRVAQANREDKALLGKYMPSDVEAFFPFKWLAPNDICVPPGEWIEELKEVNRLQTPVPSKPEIKFDLSEESLKSNEDLLKSCDYDMEKVFRRQKGSTIWHGSEFRPPEVIEKVLRDHPYTQYLRHVFSEGMDYHYTHELTEEQRLKELEALLERGNHKSAIEEDERVFELIQKDVRLGFAMPLPVESLKKLKGAAVQPCGCAEQFSLDMGGNRIPKKRLTHDLTFCSPEGDGMSSNKRIDMSAYPEMVYGFCLSRVIHFMAALRERHPGVPIFIQKADYSEAYRRISHAPKAAASTILVRDGVAYLMLRLAFGGSPNPACFSGFSESLTDLANELSLSNFDPSDFDLPTVTKEMREPEVYPSENDSDSLPVYASAQPTAFDIPLAMTSRKDCFLDDVIGVFLGTERNLAREPFVVPLAANLLSRPNAGKDKEPLPRKDILQETKMIAEGRPSEIRIVLGWGLDSRKMFVFLPVDKYLAWLGDVKLIIRTKRSTVTELESVLGRLNHAAYVIPLSRHFLECIRRRVKNSHSNKQTIRFTESEIQDFELWKSFLQFAHEGIHVDLLTHRNPTHLCWTDSCPYGLGGYTSSGRAFRLKVPKEASFHGHSEANNFLEFLANSVGTLLLIDESIESTHPCLQPLGDSTTAIGWMHTVGRIPKTSVYYLASKFIARHVSTKLVDQKAQLCPQHWPGHKNIIPDLLSFEGKGRGKPCSLTADCPPDDVLTNRIHLCYPQLVPESFQISPLPEEIVSFVCQAMRIFESSWMQNRKQGMRTKTESGADGSNSWTLSDSEMISLMTYPERNDLSYSNVSLSNTEKENSISKEEFVGGVRSLWLNRLSALPQALWVRRFGNITGKAPCTSRVNPSGDLHL